MFCKPVRVETKGKDKYGRTLGRVFVGDTDVNLELVRRGLAWHYVKYARKDKELTDAERDARAAKRGLWADSNPIAPWDWRKGKRDAESKTARATPAEGAYWLNTTAGVRHNSRCENYGKTKRGRPCGPGEGKPCGDLRGLAI